MSVSDHQSPSSEEQTAWVTLYSVQVAEVAVKALPGASREELLHLALRGLDESNGAEWQTDHGGVDHVAWTDDARLPRRDRRP